MPDYIKRIRTNEGDKQIDYNSLANLPIPPITEADEGKSLVVENGALVFKKVEAAIPYPSAEGVSF